MFSSALVLCTHVQDAICINVEGDFNLRNSSRSWWDTFEIELAEMVVVLCHCTFSFVDLDKYSGLVISVSREDLRLFGWDSGVPLNEVGHDSSCSLNSKRQGSNIEEKKVLNVLVTFSTENGSLDGSSICYSFVWVDGAVGFFTIEEIGDH